MNVYQTITVLSTHTQITYTRVHVVKGANIYKQYDLLCSQILIETIFIFPSNKAITYTTDIYNFSSQYIMIFLLTLCVISFGTKKKQTDSIFLL